MIKKDLVIKYSKGIDRALNELTEIYDLRGLKMDNLKADFLKDIAELENNKILHNDIEPDLSGKGNVLARRVFSIFGGNDLTFKGKCILKDIAEILSIEPGLIVLLPGKHTELVFEYLKQNLNNKYLDIIAIYKKDAI